MRSVSIVPRRDPIITRNFFQKYSVPDLQSPSHLARRLTIEIRLLSFPDNFHRFYEVRFYYFPCVQGYTRKFLRFFGNNLKMHNLSVKIKYN